LVFGIWYLVFGKNHSNLRLVLSFLSIEKRTPTKYQEPITKYQEQIESAKS